MKGKSRERLSQVKLYTSDHVELSGDFWTFCAYDHIFKPLEQTTRPTVGFVIKTDEELAVRGV